tara:strand:+ start:432 stop:1439 length:1008 start_codon:yes stop_codon:yes gene_type:complete
MENEQINQESNDSVETQEVDAIETFANALDAQESEDKPEVEDEQENEEVVAQADEETESEEVEEESDEDELEATDEDDEDSDEVEEAQTFKVKANGEEQDVTLDELVEGYQKGSDYTKKSQHLAEQRKAVEEHAYAIQEAQSLRDEYHARLGQVQEVLQNNAEEYVDLDVLKENDPIAYAVAVAERTENSKKLQAVQQEQVRLSEESKAYHSQQQAQFVQAQAKLLSEKMKDFSNPKKAEQLKGEIRNFGKSVGFSDQELGQVLDHRHVMVLHKAAQWDKLQKAKAGVTKKVANAPKMSKKGNKVANVDAYTKQKKRLKASGDIADATELFKNFI